jgi:signal transduction histidine kinase
MMLARSNDTLSASRQWRATSARSLPVITTYAQLPRKYDGLPDQNAKMFADNQFRFAVSDKGIGIGSNHHLQVFEAFKRLHGKDIPGTGIGLAICRRIVERYGRRIWVESRIGEGTLFCLPCLVA